jgi:hypothetical protein
MRSGSTPAATSASRCGDSVCEPSDFETLTYPISIAHTVRKDRHERAISCWFPQRVFLRSSSAKRGFGGLPENRPFFSRFSNAEGPERHLARATTPGVSHLPSDARAGLRRPGSRIGAGGPRWRATPAVLRSRANAAYVGELVDTPACRCDVSACARRCSQDLAYVSPSLRCVSKSVRRRLVSVSNNVRRK